MTPSPTSGPSALPDWSAVPSNREEDRVFLNERVAYFGLVTFILSGGYWSISLVIVMVLVPQARSFSLQTHGAILVHLVATAFPFLQWLLCRRRRRSARQLNAIDIGGLVGANLAYAVMGTRGMSASPETLLLLVIITMCLVWSHAVIVPGTARRSLWLGFATCVPTVFATWYLLSTRSVPVPRILPFSAVVLWCTMIVSLATLTSRIIYGLQQRVREATQIGQYTLEEKIGEGGMGTVYRARHALLRRPTAVKLLPADRAGEQNVRRFEREVQLTSSLTHPNTIAIYDYGHTPDRVFYYAMEYLDGINLEDLVHHDGPQPAGRVVHLLAQVCGALAEAHSVGLIHRDIKPANLMLCVRGGIPDHVKVLDFGLVKDVEKGAAPELSSTAVLVGTPLYMAPEAITSPERVDARTDLYALGAVAYQLLTGTPVFEGGSVLEVCGKHLHAEPEALSKRARREVPASLEKLVLDLLAKDPAKRPSSAAEVAAQLRALSGVPPWSTEDARRFWDERAPSLLAKIQSARPGDRRAESPRTVTVALDGRGIELTRTQPAPSSRREEPPDA